MTPSLPAASRFNASKGTEGNPAYEKIMVRLDTVERGSLGDHRNIGGGVVELRINFGPGYRVYLGQIGKTGELVILLIGGTKKSQDEDIKLAKKYWEDFNAE
ncbi:MAG: type II toxin-antitoxin system RelE/ParE family toxin [Candidatus Korobacteraceae bacterium]